jgi:hypothetical protein|uniref:transglutaminase domain-containing protein n=1 Tax=Candidatus Methanomassiliicoccus intestinalis TaxID=1406512 RepID=UPI0037DD7356
MVYKTAIEAAAFVSDVMATDRENSISVMMDSSPTNPESFTNYIFSAHPELIACIESLSMQAINLGAWYKLIFNIAYTEVMPSSISVVNQLDSIQELMIRDVKLHRRYTQIVFPNVLEDQVRLAIERLTESPQLLNCFIQGTTVSVRRGTGCDQMALQIKYTYSCNYNDFRLRTLQMRQSIDEIVRLSKSSGIEDWKKAFSVVKYCVQHWNYGTIDEFAGIEFSAYGALVHHTAVCMGITLAVCAIFSELGIPCRYIRGVRDGVGHAWNMVFLRGGWFYIDVTDAIGRRDPFYHWGMTSLNDRTVSDQIDVSLDCTCPESFLKMNGVI